MQTYVVSDHDAMSAKVRQALMRSGHDCPDSHVVSLARGASIVVPSELTILVMSPDPERALVSLRDMSNALGGVSLKSAASKHLLAVGPADAKLILRTIREGAEEYIDENEVETELTPVLTRIVSQIQPGGEPGQIIAVLAPSGGSGGSTVVCNVATVLAKENATVCVIDLKLGAGVQDAMFDVKPEHSMAEMCAMSDRLDRGMFERLLVRHNSGVRLLTPPTQLAEVGYVTGAGIRQGLNLARGLFKYVLVDLDRTYHEEQVEALIQSDIVILILRLDFTSLRNCRQALEHIERLGVDRQKVRLVVNRYGQPREMKMSQAEEALGLKVFAYIPDEADTVNRSNNNGVPVVLGHPKTKVGRSLIDLAHALNGQKTS